MKSLSRHVLALLLTFTLLMGNMQAVLADTLVLPAQVKTIETGAFEGDQSLDAVRLPEGIESIEARAFADSSVTQINLPDSLTWIAADAFENAANVSFDANEGSYAHRWLKDNRYILYFADDAVYDLHVDMAIFDMDDEIGLYSDSFVAVFDLADSSYWQDILPGDPVWQVSRLSGADLTADLISSGPFGTALVVDMPSAPGTAVFEVRCAWGGMEAVSRVTVSFTVPALLPQGTDIPDYVLLAPDVETVLSVGFIPAYSFGNMDRVGLEAYAGQADWWFEGHDLHIIPRESGTFAGTVTLYAGNMYIAKHVVFRVAEDSQTMDPSVEASWSDCYTLSWNAREGIDSYTVRAYLDEACTKLYRSCTADAPFVYFNTDVGTRYWFVVEYTDPQGRIIVSDAVTAEPLPVLPAPEDLTLTLLEDGHVIPSWSPVPGAYGYRIYFSTETGVWSPDTDWYAIDGGPGGVDEWDLWIDEGETLYLWVCADNGDGPNLRASARVTRSREAAMERLLELVDGDDRPETMYMTGFDFSLISTAGVTDADEIARIEAYNAAMPGFESAVNRYNAAVDELISLLDEVTAGLGLNALETAGGSFGITSDLMDFTLSAEAAELLADGLEGAELAVLSPDTLQAAVEKNGVTRYILISGTGISVSGVPYRQGTRLVPRSGDDGSQHRIDWLGVCQLLNIAASGIASTAADVVEHSPDIAKLFTGMKGWEKIAGVAKYLGPALDAFGVGVAIASGNADSQKLARLGAIAGHGHPTAVEALHSASLSDAAELNAKIGQARLLAASDLLLNAAGASLGVIALASLFVAPEAGGVYSGAMSALKTAAAKSAVLGMNIAGFSIGALLDSLMDEIDRLDRRLHYDAFGALTEEDTGNHMRDVEIEYNNINYRLTTTELGQYQVELPTAEASLTFRKEGYFDQSEVFSVPPYELARHDVIMRRKPHVTVEGVVKDQFGDPVGYASIVSGTYTGTAREDGTFSISLPAESRNIIFSKTGYISASMNVTLSQEGNLPLEPVLNWQYGVHGVVTDESGPLAGAWVSFRKYAVSNEGSWSAYTDENGEFRHILPPGNYTLTISKNNCIRADLVHGEWKESVTVQEQGITEFEAPMISIGGRYCVQISASIPEFSNETRYHTGGSFSWLGYAVQFDFADEPTVMPLGFYCVSETRYVSIHAHVTGTVNDVLKTYDVTRTIDLESLKAGQTSIILDLGSPVN